MRARLHSKLIAALLAPLLLASGASQAMLLVRCGSTLRLSCCCPKQAPLAPSAALTGGMAQPCDRVAVPAAPAQEEGRLTPIGSAPVLLARLAPTNSAGGAAERLPPIPRLDPPPGPSPVLANCALLI